jgi:hypothetical protein
LMFSHVAIARNYSLENLKWRRPLGRSRRRCEHGNELSGSIKGRRFLV